jgi:hypothetical protein
MSNPFDHPSQVPVRGLERHSDELMTGEVERPPQHQPKKNMKLTKHRNAAKVPQPTTPKASNATVTLNDYAKQVTEIHRGIEDAERTIIQTGKKNIAAAITAGNRLIKAKSLVKHGQWLPWVEKNLKGISQATVNRYMALAAFACSSDAGKLKDCDSLREAYLVAGIISEKGTDDDDAENTDTDDAPDKVSPDAENTAKERKTPLERIKEHRRKLQSLLIGFEDNEVAVNELAPLAMFYIGYLQRMKAKEEKAQREKWMDKEFATAIDVVALPMAA